MIQGRMWLVIGGILGGLGVLLGAFGAHGLPKVLGSVAQDSAEFPKRVEWFETAARYHMYHAFAICIVGIMALVNENEGIDQPAALSIAGIAFLIGIAIFSGCLYALALTGERMLGAIVPVGGVAMVVGWFALALAGWGMNGLAAR